MPYPIRACVCRPDGTLRHGPTIRRVEPGSRGTKGYVVQRSLAAAPLRRLLVLVITVLGVLVPLTARADDQNANLTATDILTKASQQLANTKSVRFKLAIDGDTYVDSLNTLKLLQAEGDLVRPDRVRTSFKVEALGRVTVTVQLIIVGNQWWTTDLITGKWGPAPADFEYDPKILFDNQNGIGPIMDHVTDAQRLDDEKINGNKAFHIQAKVEDKVIGPLTYNTLTGSPITVDLWIDQQTYNLVRAKLAEPPTQGANKPVVWTLDLFDHDADIKIDPPSS
jgi:hypothetical protein